MSPQLEALIESTAKQAALESQIQELQRQIGEARIARQAVALELKTVPNADQRVIEAVWAYKHLAPGVFYQLAEVATGRPGRKGQAVFLDMVGRKHRDPPTTFTVREEPDPLDQLRPPVGFERDLALTHAAHGAPLWIELSGPQGPLRFDLPAALIELYITHPAEAFGRVLGVAPGILINWLTSQGVIYCGATTKKDARCRVPVAYSDDPRKWGGMLEEEHFCAVHGG